MAMKDDRDDKRIAGWYHDAAAPTPPSHLDGKIVSAARRAVDSRPGPANPFTGRWQIPASLAAVLLVTVLLVPLVSERVDEEALSDRSMPAEALRKQAPGSNRAEKPAAALPLSEADAVSPPRELLEAPAAPKAEVRRVRPPAPAAAPGRHEIKQSAPAEVRGLSAITPPSQTDWLARIRRLLDAGDEPAATEQLRAFTRHYPDYALPADLQALQAGPPPADQ